MPAQVYYCNIEPLRDEELFLHYCKHLPSFRRARLDSLHRHEDRLRSVAGWIMLQCGLDALHVPQERRSELWTRSGKPYLPDAPFHFSISHSGFVVLCVLSDGEVGADVQKLHVPSQALLQRVCTDAEREWLSGEQDLAGAFTSLWTRKESLLKATGRTIAADLRKLCCLPGQMAEQDDKRWRFFEQELFGLPASVCSAEESDGVNWNPIDLSLAEIQNSFDSSS